MYGEANLYLLDDPLSAVDPQIEHHLFDECIRKLLKNSAVVLVTHQLPIAQLSDKVMVLKEVRTDYICIPAVKRYILRPFLPIKAQGCHNWYEGRQGVYVLTIAPRCSS